MACTDCWSDGAPNEGREGLRLNDGREGVIENDGRVGVVAGVDLVTEPPIGSNGSLLCFPRFPSLVEVDI